MKITLAVSLHTTTMLRFSKYTLFSSIEGEYVPLPGDEVNYRLCPIPPKFEKNQAVHVRIVHLTPEKHLKWDEPPL